MAVERTFPSSSEEKETIEKGKTPGDQGQKETFYTSLYLIPTSGQTVEERESLNTSEEQESIGKKEKRQGIKGRRKSLMHPYN